jgi:hypothetical protein
MSVMYALVAYCVLNCAAQDPVAPVMVFNTLSECNEVADALQEIRDADKTAQYNYKQICVPAVVKSQAKSRG